MTILPGVASRKEESFVPDLCLKLAQAGWLAEGDNVAYHQSVDSVGIPLGSLLPPSPSFASTGRGLSGSWFRKVAGADSLGAKLGKQRLHPRSCRFSLLRSYGDGEGRKEGGL